MNAVGKLHSTGVSSKIRIARPYPAPCTICSVPYVPPDTMKNVAATSGQRVNLAILFLVVEIVLAGSWAGRDKELNFCSRPPNDPRSRCHGEASSHSEEYKSRPCMQQENAFRTKIFSLPLTIPLRRSLPGRPLARRCPRFLPLHFYRQGL